MQNSKFLSLNTIDLVKGLITAVFGAVAGMILPIIQSGSFSLDWVSILKTATVTALAYLAKNLFTNSDGQFMKKG